MGDFNEMVDNTEKVGGVSKSATQLEPFRSAIEDCSLGDLGYKGSKFTWCNHCEGDDFIKERLDCALANAGWCAHFPDVEVEILAARSSDHKPMWVRFFQGHNRMTRRSFRYEASWNLDDESTRVIKAEWENELAGENPLTITKKKLERCASALTVWNQLKYGAASRTIRRLTKELEALQREQKAEDREAIRCLQGELNHLLEMEDIRWRQRAKRNWFQRGDQNTKFFHAWANH